MDANGEPKGILVADDEPIVREVVRGALKLEGYALLEACNANDALRICREHVGPIHLALLDILMPGASGVELLASLRKMFPVIKVLFMSGYSHQQAFDRAGVPMHSGAFIGKPFTPAQLRERIRQILTADDLTKASPA